MTKDFYFNTAEAMDKAKADRDKPVTPVEYIPVIKQARALDKMAAVVEPHKNAKELGLDYEPVFCEYCGGNDDADFGLPTDHCTDCARPQPAAQPAPVQEPVSMRMPKVGDKVVCLEDESIGTVVYLTAGGSPEIKFDDGSHGTYMLREFAELFGYITPPGGRQSEDCLTAAQRQSARSAWVHATEWRGLTDEERVDLWKATETDNRMVLIDAIEAKLKEKNNG